MTWHKEKFIISDEKHFLDADYIYDYLSNKSYWAENIPMEIVKKSIEGSFCFGVYHKENNALAVGRQVGFARVITDKATFGYLADVFIDEDYRGNGLGKWLVETIISYSELQGLRGWMLRTKDAHGLYAKFGFVPVIDTSRLMSMFNPDVYPKKASGK